MDSVYQQDISLKDLVNAGVHFGHPTSCWNPKMRLFILREKNGIHIIDLSKTIGQLKIAVQVLCDVVESKKRILFVGNKTQAKSVVKDIAESTQEFYVCERWLGGILTNFLTIRKSVAKMDKMGEKLSGEIVGLKKKEIARLHNLHAKLSRSFSGIQKMTSLPGMLVVVDPIYENIAVTEARKLKIPIMAIVDTNCDPDVVDYVIAGNDDALKSNKAIMSILGNAIIKKKQALGLIDNGSS